MYVIMRHLVRQRRPRSLHFHLSIKFEENLINYVQKCILTIMTTIRSAFPFWALLSRNIFESAETRSVYKNNLETINIGLFFAVVIVIALFWQYGALLRK